MNRNQFLLLLLSVICLCSCSTEERLLKKFASRLSMKEYDAASLYVSPQDRMQFAFFVREAYSKAHPKLKVVECRLVESTETPYLEAALQWENINPELLDYFNSIGHPTDAKGMQTERFYIMDDKLLFPWGIPDVKGADMRLYSIAESSRVGSMNIRAKASVKSAKIATMPKGGSIMANGSTRYNKDWLRGYWVEHGGALRSGYIYARSLQPVEYPIYEPGWLSCRGSFVLLIIGIVFMCGIPAGLYLMKDDKVLGWIAVLICLPIGYQALEKLLFNLFLWNLPF